MKTLKKLFYLLISCILTFCISSCQEDGPGDSIWDFYPIQIHITLTGENGEDLLNPATPGTYAGLITTATYQDETYVKDVFYGNNVPYESRAYMAHLDGIYTIKLQDGRYALRFGELNGDDTYKNETITIDWGNGTEDVITFSSKLKWKGNDPVFNRSYKLNGKEVDKDTRTPIIDVKKSALKNDADYDIQPIVFNIFLMNEQGYDLLNTNVEGHIQADSVKAIFQGKEYYLETTQDSYAQAYQAEFTGLTRPRFGQVSTSAYPTHFGELDGTDTFENEMLIMDWGALGQDTITFTSKMEWKDNRPFFIRNYKLNGKDLDKDTARPNIHIRKPIE